MNLSLACAGIESILGDGSLNASVWSAIRIQSDEVNRLIDETNGIINSLNLGLLDQEPLDESIPELTESEADYSRIRSFRPGIWDL